MVYSLLTTTGNKLIDIIKNLDLGSIFTIAIGAGSVYGIITIAKALEALTSPMEVFADIGETFNRTLKRFNGVLSAVKFKIYAESVKTMAVAIAILAGSIVVLTMVDQGKMWSAVGAIVALAAVLGVLTFVSGKIGGKEGVQFGKLALTLLALGFSMLLMASALKKISGIDPEQGKQTIMGFVGIVGAMALLIGISNKTKSGFLKLGSAFLGIAAALLIMAIVAKRLGNMHPEELRQGGQAIGMFSLIIVGLMAATKLLTGSKNVGSIANTIAKVGTAILMMAIVVKLLGGMDEYELKQGSQAIVLFSAIIVGLMAATKLISGSKNVATIGKTITGIAGAILLMAVAVRVLGMMSPESLTKGMIAVTALGGIVTGLIAATKLAGKDLDKVGRTILMVGVAVGLLGITATLLSLISWEGLAKGLIAVGFLSAFMAGLMFATKFVPPGIMGSLITLTVVIGLLALSVGILSAIDPSRLAGATAALGVLMGMFSLILAASSLATGSLANLIVITVAIGVLAGALYLVAQLPIENTKAAVTGLTALLVGLSATLLILALVGSLGPAAFIGIAALATLIVALTAVFVGIGALMEKVPELKTFLDSGLSVLIQIAGGLGEMIGAFVKGALTQISSSLPAIATNLSLFMTNLTPFITGARMIGLDVLAGVGILTATIIALSVASLIEGIASFLTFGSSFAELGTQLSQFMINAMPFIRTAMMIPPGVTDSAKALADTIITLTKANLIEGINRFLGGNSSMETFAAQLPILGLGLRSFIDSLGVISEEQVTTAQNAANIIKTLAQAASEIPNTGGLLGDLVGNNDMGPWAEQLPIMAKGIVDFINVLTEAEISSSSVGIANNAAEIIKTLAQAASEIPNTGGLLADLIGDNDLTTFAKGLPAAAEGIVGFINKLTEGNVSEESSNIANNAAKVIKTLASTAKAIPNTGGFLADLVGDNDLGDFAKKLPDVGKGIAGFAKELGEFSEDKILTINSAVTAVNAITELGKINIKDTGKGLKSLGEKMVDFAKKIKSFVNTLSEVGSKSIDSAIGKVGKLVEMAKTIADTNADSLKEFGESLKTLAKNGVKNFVDEFSGSTAKNNAKDAAKKFVQAAIDGVKDNGKKKKLKEAAESLAEEAIKAMSSEKLKSDAKQSGKDLCQGLINGLKNKDKRQAVYDAAYSLGQLAVQGEKDGQNSNSPSKATEQAGKWLGEGLVIGIQKMGSSVYGAGKSMGEEVTNSISSALNTALNLLNSDMDAQPTIRPILDLSDVESGVGSLSSMFNNGPSLGVAANLKAINSSMNARSQNGTTNDVVSAINKLGRSLGNVGGDTYNINGVSVNDDSGLADAVRTIIRAANIERRI